MSSSHGLWGLNFCHINVQAQGCVRGIINSKNVPSKLALRPDGSSKLQPFRDAPSALEHNIFTPCRFAHWQRQDVSHEGVRIKYQKPAGHRFKLCITTEPSKAQPPCYCDQVWKALQVEQSQKTLGNWFFFFLFQSLVFFGTTPGQPRLPRVQHPYIQHRSREVSSLQVGTAQVGMGQVAAAQIGHLEVDVAKIQARKISSTEIQTLEKPVSPPQNGHRREGGGLDTEEFNETRLGSCVYKSVQINRCTETLPVP